MTSRFLYRFSEAVIRRLVRDQRVEIAPREQERVVAFVTEILESAREGSSLVSTLSGALMRCPQVEELYADEDELKELIQDLGTT